MFRMKHLIYITTALALCVSPAAAQDDGTDIDDGVNLMEEGAKLLLRGLMTEMEPAIADLRDLADEMEPAMRDMMAEMGPALADMINKIDDFRNYDAPEILPNGDIIMRRRAEAPEFTPVPQTEIDL